MSAEKKPIDNSVEEILDYLNTHPDFFVHHPELLTKLNIPHEISGTNVSSFVEHQVARFRQETAKMQNVINFLEEQACSGRKLARQMHNLAIELIAMNDLNTLYDLLDKKLKKYYLADEVRLLIFKQPACKSNYPGLQFYPPDSKLEFMFTEIFHRKNPLCDSLQEEHIEALFNENDKPIQSTVLTPLQQADWKGLFVLGSYLHNRYNRGFEIDLLVYLSRIMSHVIKGITNP